MKRTLITGLLAIAPLVASAATVPNVMDQEQQQINKIIQKLDIHVGSTPKQQVENLAKMSGWLHKMNTQERSFLLKILSSSASHDLQPLKNIFRLALVADDMNKKAMPDFRGIEDTEINYRTGRVNTTITSPAQEQDVNPRLKAEMAKLGDSFKPNPDWAMKIVTPKITTHCSALDLFIGGPCYPVNGQSLMNKVQSLTKNDRFFAYSLALQSISPEYYHTAMDNESLRLALGHNLESKKQNQLLQKIEHNQEVLIDLLKHQQAV